MQLRPHGCLTNSRLPASKHCKPRALLHGRHIGCHHSIGVSQCWAIAAHSGRSAVGSNRLNIVCGPGARDQIREVPEIRLWPRIRQASFPMSGGRRLARHLTRRERQAALPSATPNGGSLKAARLTAGLGRPTLVGDITRVPINGMFEVVGDITNIQVIATGHGIKRLKHLRKRYGGRRWRKLKGKATIRLVSGSLPS